MTGRLDADLLGKVAVRSENRCVYSDFSLTVASQSAQPRDGDCLHGPQSLAKRFLVPQRASYGEIANDLASTAQLQGSP